MVSFSSESTIHGINFIFGETRSRNTKIFWIFWFFWSFFGFVYYIYISSAKWLLIPDLVLKISQRPTREFPFPALTICSPVFAKHSEVDFRITEELGENFKPFLKKECEYILANSHWCQQPNLYSTIVHCPDGGNKELNVIQLVNESSYNSEELFYKHPFRRFIDNNEEKLSPLAKFDKILTDQGFCYTTNLQNHDIIFNDEISEDFDSFKRKIILKSSNPHLLDEQIEVEMKDTKQWTLEGGYPNTNDETFPVRAMLRHSALIIPKLDDADLTNICNEQQFSLIFHLPNEIPTRFHKSYPLQFGSMKKFRVSLTSQQSDEAMRGFKPESRGCYFDGERQLKFFRTYTKPHCDWECITNFTLETCGCVKFSMPRDNKTRICTLLESKCYVEAMDSWPKYSSSEGSVGKPCGCLSTCTDIKYNVEVQIDSTFNQREREKFTSWAMVGVSDYVAVVQENVVNYKVQNFIADSGGLLGLFMGCSLLSIVELFYFGTIALMDFIKRKRMQKKILKVRPRRNVKKAKIKKKALQKLFIKMFKKKTNI